MALVRFLQLLLTLQNGYMNESHHPPGILQTHYQGLFDPLYPPTTKHIYWCNYTFAHYSFIQGSCFRGWGLCFGHHLQAEAQHIANLLCERQACSHHNHHYHVPSRAVFVPAKVIPEMRDEKWDNHSTVGTDAAVLYHQRHVFLNTMYIGLIRWFDLLLNALKMNFPLPYNRVTKILTVPSILPSNKSPCGIR